MDGKVVLMTGASSLIAFPTVRRFLDQNARIVLVDKTEHALTLIAKECKGKALLIPADLTSDDDVRRVVSRTIEKFTKLDVLINLTEEHIFGNIESTTLESLDGLFKHNVRSLFLVIKYCVPHLIKTKGIVLNLSNNCTRYLTTNELAYSLTKVMVDQMTKCVAKELADKGVRVNALSLGPTEGLEWTRRVTSSSRRSSAYSRNVTPGEVADAIEFLLVKGFGFYSGQLFYVGGTTLGEV